MPNDHRAARKLPRGDVDQTMGPCVGCKKLGADLDVHHTSCECDKECGIVICDQCRMYEGIWTWDGEEDDMVEAHIDCYRRMHLSKESDNAKGHV